MTFLPFGLAYPKLRSWGLLDQVLRFFWRGVYNVGGIFDPSPPSDIK